MSNEMIERVARAINEYTPHNKEFYNLTIGERDILEDQARASIEAMREPTKSMVISGQDELNIWDSSSLTIWRTMIDEALS